MPFRKPQRRWLLPTFIEFLCISCSSSHNLFYSQNYCFILSATSQLYSYYLAFAIALKFPSNIFCFTLLFIQMPRLLKLFLIILSLLQQETFVFTTITSTLQVCWRQAIQVSAGLIELCSIRLDLTGLRLAPCVFQFLNIVYKIDQQLGKFVFKVRRLPNKLHRCTRRFILNCHLCVMSMLIPLAKTNYFLIPYPGVGKYTSLSGRQGYIILLRGESPYSKNNINYFNVHP